MMGEIELLNHLDHPNIVKYLATIKSKDYLNIVLEFVENGSLANTVKKFGSLPESLIAIYIEQILQVWMRGFDPVYPLLFHLYQ